METKKFSSPQSQTKPSIDNPLADIAGKFGGKFWLDTQSEIENSRKVDKEKINKLLDDKSNEQD